MSLYSQEKTGKGYEQSRKIRKTNEWRGGAKIFAPRLPSFFINDKGEKSEKNHNLGRDYSYLVLPDCNF